MDGFCGQGRRFAMELPNMSKKSDEQLKGTVRISYQAAMNARSTSQAHGLLFSNLLRVLLGNNILDQSKIKLVFIGAVSTLDASAPSDEASRELQHHMRHAIEHVAKSFGIEVPSPVETTMQRKH
jgi:hypothetical protein